MRKEYDFSSGYFQAMAKEAGIPYQTLINLYLRDCAASRRKLRLRWGGRL